MPYDISKDPYAGLGVDNIALGHSGVLVTPDDDTDLNPYARLRVFVPEEVAEAQVVIIPAKNEDSAPLTLLLTPGQVNVLEYIARRVLDTGTTAGLTIHTVQI